MRRSKSPHLYSSQALVHTPLWSLGLFPRTYFHSVCVSRQIIELPSSVGRIFFGYLISVSKVLRVKWVKSFKLRVSPSVKLLWRLPT